MTAGFPLHNIKDKRRIVFVFKPLGKMLRIERVELVGRVTIELETLRRAAFS